MKTAKKSRGVGTSEIKPPPIVEVRWIDIFTRDGWEEHGSIEKETGECWTVGYLLSKDQHQIVLMGSWSVTESMSKTTIPIGAVRSITELRK